MKSYFLLALSFCFGACNLVPRYDSYDSIEASQEGNVRIEREMTEKQEDPRIFTHTERDDSGMMVFAYQYYLDDAGEQVFHGEWKKLIGYGTRKDKVYEHGKLIECRQVDIDY